LLTFTDLNDDIFPLNTNTYPVTKNIKAELAGVVIIAVVGIVSQMRVWKLVKQHREKTAAQQLERQQDQDREEEEQGRKVEDNFQKERAQWEAAYGGKGAPETSVRSSVSSPKGSTHIEEKEVYGNDSVERLNAPNNGVMRSASNSPNPGASVTVGVPNDDGIEQIGPETPTTENALGIHTPENEKALPAAPEDGSRPTLAKSNSLRPSVPLPPPSVVPLPFKIPCEEDARSDDDNASVSALPESGLEAEESRRLSKRVSDVSAMRQRISRDMVLSQEAMMGSRPDEDDRASSLAATLDDDLDALSSRNLSPLPSPIGTEHDDPLARPGLKRQDSDTVPSREKSSNGNAAPTSLTTSTDPKTKQSHNKHPTKQDSVVGAGKGTSSSKASSEQYSKSNQSEALSQGSQLEQGGSQVDSLAENVLPEKLSKVALSYRTNEWAKHLEAADKPDYEDMFRPSSPGIMLANGLEEKPTPVSEELAADLFGNKRDSRRMSTGSRMQRNSSNALRRNTSTFSQESLVNQRSLTHSPSIASPGMLSRSSSAARLDTLSPLPSNTLLSKRESLIKNRASALTLTPQSSSPNLLSQHEEEEEEMTLAQRRQLLQQQQLLSPTLTHQSSLRSPGKTPPSASQKWQKKAWATKGAPAGFDSHQPKRANSSAQSEQKREQLYAGWRDTMRDIAPPQNAVHMAEQQRAALMMERRQKDMEKQQRELMQQQRASQMDSMMRSGQMMDAHREAMRKMQANANRHT
jgi:hypothetical protein